MGKLGRRQFLKTIGAAPAAGACGFAGRAKPNIVLIITDQQHIDTIAALGCRHVRTPAMDELARRGTSFTDSYCADPICSPSRSAIFTGRMPSEADVASNGRRIRAGIPNLGEWFREKSGYETCYAGKWHLPRGYTGRIPGFQVLPGGVGGEGNVGDSSVSRACEDFLRNRASGRPFLLVASFLQPHDICEWLRLNLRDPGSLPYPDVAGELPELPPNFDYEPFEPRHLQRLRQRNEPAKGQWSERHWRYYMWSYYRHVEMVDGEIGRILEALDAAGRKSDTVILFTADHGEGLARHQMVRKSSSYEESVKVPFLVCWPGEFPEGRRETGKLVSGLDITPTLCDCAGIPPPPNCRGWSLRPSLTGRKNHPRQMLVIEIPPDAGRVVRTPQFKYVTYAGDTLDQLFDLRKDPGETTNVAARDEVAGVIEEHRRLLREWEEMLEPAPNQPNADAWWRPRPG